MRYLSMVCLGILIGSTLPAQATETARDVRTSIRTNPLWDYQPGQGPRPVRDRDFFNPFKSDYPSNYKHQEYPVPAKDEMWHDTASIENTAAPEEITVTTIENTTHIQEEEVAIASIEEIEPAKEEPIKVAAADKKEDDTENVTEDVIATDDEPYVPTSDLDDTGLSTATKNAINIGVFTSSYHYSEKSPGVKIQGPRYGATFDATKELGNNWFLRADARGAAKNFNYAQSEEKEDSWSFIGEFRANIGYDFFTDHFAISPYVGLGYRYLNSHVEGTTSTAATTYKNDSHYFYIPIGLQQRLKINDDSMLTVTGEFDYLIYGKQISHLSDQSGYPDLSLHQRRGYGVRGEIMYQTSDWAVGPFARYWNIKRSTTDCQTGTLYSVCGHQNINTSFELGVQFRYSLY